jgi:hypothetical protein
MAGAEGEAGGQATFYLEGGAGRALGLPPALEPGARSLCKGGNRLTFSFRQLRTYSAKECVCS